MTTILRKLLFFMALIVIWEVTYRLNLHFEWMPTRSFPDLMGVLEQLYIGFFGEHKILLYAIFTSLKRLFTGFALALVIGTVLGILLARYKAVDDTLGSLIIALQSVPSIVWLPLAMIWFGRNDMAIIFIIVLGGTWSMALNTRMGFKNVQPLLLRAARTMGYSGFELFRKVTFPASIPYALTGARLAWAFNWRALIAAELLATGGLGSTLLFAADFFNMNLVVAIMVIISVMGIIMDQLVFQRVEQRVLTRWGLERV
ncbi:sulfate ABC transporter permease [Caldalkalibacillus thermarum]|uniref:ABC transporter permease n=1 Tax=Caldalkalibacillus thermarum TaxID=296745 RepID=UPI00166D16FC|nr:ABC transporter permease [Caldalkalibacillus thermarum]GGK28795.1 sulfate ABC transporter permease [Caldalkalibacillus thermarum]